VVCILIPRFPLLAALGGRRERLLHPAALAPEPGGSQAVGEVSGAAEAFGVRAGMALGEALSRCPELALVTPDAERTESMWEELVGRLESVGAAVEPGRPGEAYFEAEGLEGISGGHLEGVLNRVRRALGMPARIGAAPARFASYAAAWGARGRGAKRRAIVPPGAERAFLAPLPVSLLIDHVEVDDRPRDSGREAEHVAGMMIVELERLGIRTLGELAALPSGAVADRFGAVGLRAHELAGGMDRPLRPRPPREEVSESLELPEAASGSQLAHALSLLVGRLLAHPARRGRSFRRLRITGRLAGGGGWRSEVTLRQASAEPELLRLALLPRLEGLPGPATRLGLQALVLGPLGHDQPALSRSPRECRRDRLGEAVRQARAAGGRDAVLRVLDVDVSSRVPERRVMLTPFPEAPE
jgi:nucleotidyltransferase/DNA polymerase involved in DNA repair